MSSNILSLSSSYLDLSSLNKLIQVNSSVNKECGLKIALDCIHQLPVKSFIEGMWKKKRLEQLVAKPELLRQLDIHISAPRMMKVFREYGILVLREPKDVSQLLLFCGNSPLVSSAMSKVYSAKEQQRHAHAGFLTIDCDALMNPSIVASWPSPEVQRYLMDSYPGFQSIEGENMAFTSKIADGQKELDSALGIMQTLLAPEGQCTTDITLYSLTTSMIEESAPRFALDVAFKGKGQSVGFDVVEATFTKIEEALRTIEETEKTTSS